MIAYRAFVPLDPPTGQNSTQWQKVQYLFQELGSSREYILFIKAHLIQFGSNVFI